MMYIKINQLHFSVLPFDYGLLCCVQHLMCEVYKIPFMVSYSIICHPYASTWRTEMKNHFSTFNSPFYRHARFEQSVRLHSPLIMCDPHVLVGLILMPSIQCTAMPTNESLLSVLKTVKIFFNSTEHWHCT